MVHLILSSSKGNQGLKYFPYTGYLGLTPVRVEGVVRTKLDADQRPLHAKSLTVSVRCYESRVGRVNTLYSNLLVDYTETLWSKPDSKDFEQVGNLEYPFRISLPTSISGFSTAVFVDYRCVWRVEAVLTHVPISGVGSRQIKHFELPLIRYDIPPHIPTPPTPPEPRLENETVKSRAPKIRYSIYPPTTPIGPLDLVAVPIHLQPLDSSVSIRSASIIVERRIVLNDTVSASSLPSPTSSLSPQPSPTLAPKSPPQPAPSPSSLLSFLPPILDHSSGYNPLASTSSLSSSNPTITPGTIYPSSSSLASETRPLLAPSSSSPTSPTTPSPQKVVTNTIINKESTSNLTRDPRGVWSKTLTFQWPAAKSHSRWAIGETIQSDLVSVRFFVKVKIGISSTSGTDSVELEEKELIIVSTNDSERQLAISKYNELYKSHDHSGRSKSKSPRRSRIPLDGDIPPSPAPSSSYKGKSTPRRPHTSAGPRDKSSGFGGSSSSSPYARPRDGDRDVGTSSLGDRDRKRNKLEPPDSRKRPDTSQSSEAKRSSTVTRGFFSHSSFNAPRVSNTISNSTTASSSSISSSSNGGDSESDQHMREWEEELARIEMRSRRSSDLLGFAGKRKRSAGTPRVVLPGEESV